MEYILETKNVTKRISRGSCVMTILQDVSLAVRKGEIFGIIGQSGAGKSSLLKCLCSLDSNFSGEITLCGEKLSSKKQEELQPIRKKISLISQQYHLIQGKTVFENVSLPLVLDGLPYKDKVKSLLDLVGLSHRQDAYPSMLSGGEKQRVAIARALARDPLLLFCDEITSALDPQRSEEILSLLQKLNTTLGVTLVFVTHEMRAIRRICHQVAVLDQGMVVEVASPLQLFGAPKHPVTRGLLESTQTGADSSILEELREKTPNLLFLRLHFAGEDTEQPLLSALISSLHLEINILCGWIDRVSGVPVGSLTIALSSDKKKEVLDFCSQHQVRCEVLS